MAPVNMIPCRFFALGVCRNGDSCKFVHARNNKTQTHFGPVVAAFPPIERLNINPAAATDLNSDGRRSPAIVPSQQLYPDATSLEPFLGQQNESSIQAPSDSRARVPCKFVSRPGGCRSKSCPYLHAGGGHELEKSSGRDLDIDESEDQEHSDDFTRDISGASVCFNEFGHVFKVSLPTDFSLACITGLPLGSTPEAVVDMLRGLSFNIDVDCVRIVGHAASNATVKVEDPLFAKELSARLKIQRSALSATSIPVDARRTNWRKVYISWHKATRSAWVNFGNGEIANRVAQKFNEGRYKCLGQSIKSTAARRCSSRGDMSGLLHNPRAWTITLSDVSRDATSRDVERAITSPHDRPRHVEMGSVSYRDSDAEVSVEVRSLLERHGPVEGFYLTPASQGKRVKATAWFQNEADARSACSLNNRALEILGKGKLTVTLVQSTKIKVSTPVYFASKSRIDQESKTWKGQHLAFHIYPDALQRFTTLKLEGENKRDLANARKTLDEVLGGVVLTDGENAVWGSALNSNGSAYEKLKSIEKELHIVITRDKSKRQLQFYGPPEKIHQTVGQITDMLKEESFTSYEIKLNPDQFSWMIHGGFKSIVQALGKNIAVFNVVSRRISINGAPSSIKQL